ncbi:hypothetical protein [Paraferrimonas sedimenticola]|uniref:Uncharacterized protein n=1 Tax=Paraferrimonas sedimenticola TaxID=375674 RepID=A0AA37RVB8_9GAMM|nr:hypothetical protein [Paraferrimonas sedimenticola]GLP96380.1 hypothetical protein GCM10007895_16860 [Paraferrimonas sedimenticola]
MYQYSVALAVYDYIPILLSAIGLYYLTKALQTWHPPIASSASLAAALIVAGGLCKATWKLLISTMDVNVMALNHALMLFMAPGFILLTWCVWTTRRYYANRPTSPTSWRCPASTIATLLIVVVVLALQFPDKRLWFFALLGALTLSNIIFAWHAVRHSWQTANKGAAILYLLNVIAVFAMSGLARVGDNSESFQWIAQLSNTVTQGLFAGAGYLLWKARSPQQNFQYQS